MKKCSLSALFIMVLMVSGCSTTQSAPDGSSSTYERSGLSEDNKFLATRTLTLLGWGVGIAALVSLVAADDNE